MGKEEGGGKCTCRDWEEWMRAEGEKGEREDRKVGGRLSEEDGNGTERCGALESR